MNKQQEYFQEYRRKKMLRIEITITSDEMRQWLEQKSSKATYIKELIAKDMRKEKKK